MMLLCWKYLVPLSFLNLLGTAAWTMLVPEGSLGGRIVSWALVLLALSLVVLFGLRVRMNLRQAGVDRLDLNPIVRAR
jgi:hypothetical protein